MQKLQDIVANRALGQRLVLPTVFRIINGKQGSLQFLVDSDLDLRKMAHPSAAFEKWKNLSLQHL